ncbi:MAG: hypothetical protein LUF30_03420, partial [Lachnospiraceae bacterium]|nr:hypothetical protein [Lachnospiraceae bacterium]
ISGSLCRYDSYSKFTPSCKNIGLEKDIKIKYNVSRVNRQRSCKYERPEGISTAYGWKQRKRHA